MGGDIDLVTEIRAKIQEVAERNKLNLVWKPVRTCWKENERAYENEKSCTNQIVSMPKGMDTGKIRQGVNEERGMQHQQETSGKIYGVLELLRLSRSKMRVVVTLMTGHNILRKYRHSTERINS